MGNLRAASLKAHGRAAQGGRGAGAQEKSRLFVVALVGQRDRWCGAVPAPGNGLVGIGPARGCGADMDGGQCGKDHGKREHGQSGAERIDIDMPGQPAHSSAPFVLPFGLSSQSFRPGLPPTGLRRKIAGSGDCLLRQAKPKMGRNRGGEGNLCASKALPGRNIQGSFGVNWTVLPSGDDLWNFWAID